MATNYIVVALLVLLVSWTYNVRREFMTRLAAAKKSGIPYIVHPIFLFNPFWMPVSRAVVKWLRAILPHSWTYPWLDTFYLDWTWDSQHAVFNDLGDNILTVAPGGLSFWTADPDVINQITTRRTAFVKPLEIYRVTELYGGHNVVSTEAEQWRLHRKVVGPPFNEKSNHLVWTETLQQTQNMVKSWIPDDQDSSKTMTALADDTMRLSLHIISRVGFGRTLFWPGVEDEQIKAEQAKLTTDSTGGRNRHQMTYTDALSTLLHNVLPVLLLPKWLMRILPFASIKQSYQSYIEWGQYMEELVQIKKAQLDAGDTEVGTDVLSAMLRSSRADGSNDHTPVFTESDIMGNAFVLLLAGHETTANSMHFASIFLAMNRSAQLELQADLDQTVEGRPISSWDYDRDLPNFFGGMPGAVLAEQLRLVPPVIGIPKKVTPDRPQTVTIDGKSCTLPANCFINLCANVVQRNPRYWPAGRPSDPNHPAHPRSNLDNDLEEFKPSRWILHEHEASAKSAAGNGRLAPDAFAPSADTAELAVNTSADTAASLFKPLRGAYIPFSDGFRACLGRRFAQVEVMTMLAVVFSQLSVELAVDRWATDAEVERMSFEERKTVYALARDRAQLLLRTGTWTLITMKLRDDVIPLRFVKRGKERFAGC